MLTHAVFDPAVLKALEPVLAGRRVVGLGVDVSEPARMKRMRTRPKAYRAQVITQREQVLVDTASDPLQQLAAAFAVKEAVFKALGTSWLESSVTWTEVELLSPFSAGDPRVSVSGACAGCQQALQGQDWWVRLEEADGQIVALALLLGQATEDDTRAEQGTAF